MLRSHLQWSPMYPPTDSLLPERLQRRKKSELHMPYDSSKKSTEPPNGESTRQKVPGWKINSPRCHNMSYHPVECLISLRTLSPLQLWMVWEVMLRSNQTSNQSSTRAETIRRSAEQNDAQSMSLLYYTVLSITAAQRKSNPHPQFHCHLSPCCQSHWAECSKIK